MKKTALVLTVITALFCQPCPLRAQEPLDSIKNASDGQSAEQILDSAFRAYGQAERYNDFADMLANVAPRTKEIASQVDYYWALARYSQLRFLEEKQLWDEYFSRGNDYRSEIVSHLESALKSAPRDGKLAVLSRLLAWKFRRDQQDPQHEEALKNFTQAAAAYARNGESPVIKRVADELSSYGEKAGARNFYRLFLERSVSAQTTPEEIFGRAEEFAAGGNRDLEENLFELYWEKSLSKMPKEGRAPVARDIAVRFSAAGDFEAAERFFGRLEESAGEDAFDQDLLYRRASGLGYAGDQEKSRRLYERLGEKFPESANAPKALLRSGLISLFVMHDAQQAQSALEKTASFAGTQEAVSARYYLGVLEQWRGSAETAKELYAAVVAASAESETGRQAALRMDEIDEGQLLCQPLRLLLDLAAHKELGMGDFSRVTLVPSTRSPKAGEEVAFEARAVVPESGCTQLVLEYAWTVDTGAGTFVSPDDTLKISFAEPGTKMVGVVVSTPQGILDRGVVFVDVL